MASKSKNGGGAAVLENPAKRTRVSHGVPIIDEDGVNAVDLTFAARTRTTKYNPIVDVIMALNKQTPTKNKLPAITFRPADGETVQELKARMASLVSRNCEAKEGARFRVRQTEDGRVCVFLDKADMVLTAE